MPTSGTQSCNCVRAPLFTTSAGFFLAADKVQVKYEMLRAHLVDQLPVTEAAATHGYSRAARHLDRPGRRHDHARDLPDAQRRPSAVADRESDLARIPRSPPAAQRSLWCCSSTEVSPG
jgi:hypothetical protein